MARNRIIKPEFWADAKVGRLSFGARLLYISMWNFSDDYGVISANARRILGDSFENTESVTIKNVNDWLEEIEKENMIIKFTANEKEWYEISAFNDHQKGFHKSERRNPTRGDNVGACAPHARRMPNGNGNGNENGNGAKTTKAFSAFNIKTQEIARTLIKHDKTLADDFNAEHLPTDRENMLRCIDQLLRDFNHRAAPIVEAIEYYFANERDPTIEDLFNLKFNCKNVTPKFRELINKVVPVKPRKYIQDEPGYKQMMREISGESANK